MLLLDTSLYERQLFNVGLRGDLKDSKTGDPRAKTSTLSLVNMAHSLGINLNCKYHNSGNDAFICLLSLQELLEPNSVPKIALKNNGTKNPHATLVFIVKNLGL